MRPGTLQRLGIAGLGLAVVAALLAGWLTAGYAPATAALFAGCALLPMAAYAGWRRSPPFAGWPWMAPYALLGFLFGFSGGGLLLYGLVPFALGNLAFRWLTRHAVAEPNP